MLVYQRVIHVLVAWHNMAIVLRRFSRLMYYWTASKSRRWQGGESGHMSIVADSRPLLIHLPFGSHEANMDLSWSENLPHPIHMATNCSIVLVPPSSDPIILLPNYPIIKYIINPHDHI
jgi:hypothetical protein